MNLPRELEILYEDDALIAINKPAGLTAVPVRGTNTLSALAVVIDALKRRRQRAYTVHRVDRFTSGVILFAKTEYARDVMVKQFLAHTPVREYLAVIRGRIAEKEGTLIHYLEKEGQRQKVRRERDPNAARAELQYKVERELVGATLLRVRLVTGLQNQIRVQFSEIGNPVIGDRKYRPEEAAERRIARVALHAAFLQFQHPMTREPVAIDCKPPGDFRSLVRSLSR